MMCLFIALFVDRRCHGLLVFRGIRVDYLLDKCAYLANPSLNP